MKYKKTTIAGIALTLALVLAVTVGFASNPGTDIPDEESTTSSVPGDSPSVPPGDALSNQADTSNPTEPQTGQNTETDASTEADTQGTVITVPAPVETGFVRVYGAGFYYDMPANGWDPYGAYFLYSAYGTDSQVEIYGTGAGGFVGEVELYESLGYAKTEETDGLTVLARTEILEFRDGTVLTARYEVYVYGQKGPDQCWVVSLKWIEENLSAKTANEPEIMRAIARSFTITTTGNQDEPHICTREDCPHQPSVHVHEADGSVTYVFNDCFIGG